MSNLTEAAAANGAGSGRYAIVGYGFRMPGGIGTAGDFWQLLSGRGFTVAPGGLMGGDEPYLFDGGLFGISARASSTLDPSLRLLLTCTWEALEQAGWDHAGLPGSRTGVFVSSLDVPLNQLRNAFGLMGLSAAYLTACSSGATALHAAVTALGHGDCDQAIVGAAGEGVFIYLVKPLAAAEQDGDRILAVIAGTAVSAASTQPAQASLMDAAAFTCALLKVLLMFQHRMYAPVSGHLAVPSPDIDFTGLRAQTECEPFGEGPVTVGIKSFGFGGADGHCLLTEYRPDRGPAWSRPDAPDAAYLIPLSARTPEALTQTAAALHELITNEPDPDLDLYTLAGNLSRRRTHFAARAAFAAASLPQLAERLDAFTRDPSPASPRPASDGSGRSGPPRILMVFAGQGTQWAGCGRALYDTEPVFRRAVDAVDAAWRDLAGFSLRDACFTASQEDLDEVRLAQPVIFLIEVALAELLKTWGVYPDGVIGHSAGEVAAAYAAGIHSLAEATRLTFHRAVLQQRTAGSGRLLAVSLDRAGTADLLAEVGDPDLEIACENAPASTVIGGPGPAVTAAAGLLGQRRVPHRLLRGNIAFHSRAMDVVEADLRAALAFLDGRPSHDEIPFVSSVTGEVTTNLDAAYWWGNVRRPVRFMAALGVAAREIRPDVVLEISPNLALTPAVRHCLAGQDRPPACVRTLGRGEDPRLSFHQALGALYRAGVPLDFAARYPRPRPASHLLPPHPKDEWRDGQRAGYLLPPPLLDGGLRAFLPDLTHPEPDTSGRASYAVRSQLKFVPSGPPPAAPDVRAVIDALSRRSPTGVDGLRVAEFTHSVRPDDTAAAGYLRDATNGAQPTGRGPEFWLVGASAPDTQRLSEAFGAGDRGGPGVRFGAGNRSGLAVRFATADLSAPASVDLAGGLLRAAACHLVVLDAAATPVTAATWDLIRRLLVPGGLALVRHPDAGFTRPGRDWSQTMEDGSLWTAPPVLADDGAAVPAAPGAPAPDGPAPAQPRPLAGALPGPCQEDLELLRSSIRELAGGRPGGPPVPADQFGAVFLTGATGFVGRFVLSELLRQNDHMLVHCLVRAPNAKQALVRVQDALESAGRWDDFLGDRIRAWPGDMREPRFGLPELDFRRLCDQVDAVYHLAAEPGPLSPYAALREASTRGARTALELALRRRAKHLVYTSAMGVFPQYFCDFAGRFAGQPSVTKSSRTRA